MLGGIGRAGAEGRLAPPCWEPRLPRIAVIEEVSPRAAEARGGGWGRTVILFNG